MTYKLPKFRKGNVVEDMHDKCKWVITKCRPYSGGYMYAVDPLYTYSRHTGTTFAEHELKLISKNNEDDKRDGTMGDDGHYDDLPF